MTDSQRIKRSSFIDLQSKTFEKSMFTLKIERMQQLMSNISCILEMRLKLKQTGSIKFPLFQKKRKIKISE